MDKFVIRGGEPLLGTVRVSWATNAARPCMAAGLLTDQPVILENIPQGRDIQTTRNLLASMGADVELGYGRAHHRTTIHCANLASPEASYELVKTMRASTLVLGPLVARCGRARVSLPGGCAIGARPLGRHLPGLEQPRAKVRPANGYTDAPTAPHSPLHALVISLHEVEVKTKVSAGSVRGMGDNPFTAADMSTEEHPGFPTDCQAQYLALATQAEGTSVITENIFENRFMHAQEMLRMGANIKIEGRRAVVRGKTPLSGAAVLASDLRASASLVLAALVADGETIIDRVYHIDRGYENIEEKLKGVGAQIRRMGEILPKKR